VLAGVIVLIAATHSYREEFMGVHGQARRGSLNGHDTGSTTARVRDAFEESRVIAIGNHEHRRIL
jgi:hypothetical protein